MIFVTIFIVAFLVVALLALVGLARLTAHVNRRVPYVGGQDDPTGPLPAHLSTPEDPSFTVSGGVRSSKTYSAGEIVRRQRRRRRAE